MVYKNEGLHNFMELQSLSLINLSIVYLGADPVSISLNTAKYCDDPIWEEVLFFFYHYRNSNDNLEPCGKTSDKSNNLV